MAKVRLKYVGGVKRVLSFVRNGKGYSYPVKHNGVIKVNEDHVQILNSLASFAELAPRPEFIKPIIETETSEVITESDMNTFIKQAGEVVEEKIEEIVEDEDEEEIVEEIVEDVEEDADDTDFSVYSKRELIAWLKDQNYDGKAKMSMKRDTLIAKCVDLEATL